MARHRRAHRRPPPVRHRPRGGEVRPFQGRYGIPQEYGGHGIGTEMHMDPWVANHGKPGSGPRLSRACASPSSRWSTSAPTGPGAGRRLDRHHRRRQASAHFEHSVAVTHNGPWVLTALDGGRERLAACWETRASRIASRRADVVDDGGWSRDASLGRRPRQGRGRPAGALRAGPAHVESSTSGWSSSTRARRTASSPRSPRIFPTSTCSSCP